MTSNNLPAPAPVRFPIGAMVRHKKGGIYRVLGTPDACRIEKTLEPAYAYISGEGAIWFRSQVEMEDGRFELLPAAASEYEDLLEMVSSGEGLLERQAHSGFSFLDVTPSRAWDLLLKSLVLSQESPSALSRFLNQVQFEAHQLRDFFSKRRSP